MWGARMPTALRITGRTASVSRERQRSRDLLVVAQVAMALVLLVSAMLMIRTFQALRHVEPGFSQPEHLQTVRISIPPSLIADPQLVTRTQNNIVDKLAAIPGVTSVGFADAMPMEGIQSNWDGVQIEGKNLGEDTPLRLFRYVAPGFFHTMGTRIDCRTRAHLDRHLRAKAGGDRFRESCPRIVGLTLGCAGQAIAQPSEHAVA